MAHDVVTGGQSDTGRRFRRSYTKDNVDECIDLHESIGDIK